MLGIIWFALVPNTTSYTSTEPTAEQPAVTSPLSRARELAPSTSIVSPQLLSPTYVPYSTLYNPRSTITKSQDYLYRLRSFNITKGGGVVNCGDTIVRRSKSNNCINEDDFGRKASLTYSPTRSPTKSQRSSPGRRGSLSPRLVVMSPLLDPGCCVATAQDYEEDEYEDELTMREFGFEDVKLKYRVVLLGESGVGKSALVRQFMTSEYINTYDMSLGGSFIK
ncbi:GTP-binding protein ryh1 [Orchesella cincta]|uniref:GTP-binding protein ryh1 n=1 Tax=Orchesella cincta TaxID=48709 RepID=A0A1D2MJ00_ORCCI|nr:GTP-binding protein ryh1 [Orchesella cincta]